MKKKKQEKFCKLCGISSYKEQIERHHLFPKCHFGQGVRILLCQKHHRELETLIRLDEGTRNGQRLERSRQFYLDITLDFFNHYHNQF